MMLQKSLELFPVNFVIFVSILQNPFKGKGNTHYTLCLREAIQKNLYLFGKSPNGLDPPPLYFFNPSKNFFLTLILDKLKFIKIFRF